MKTATEKLRDAIVTLVSCKTEAQARKCAERIDTMITEIEMQMALYDAVLAPSNKKFPLVVRKK